MRVGVRAGHGGSHNLSRLLAVLLPLGVLASSLPTTAAAAVGPPYTFATVDPPGSSYTNAFGINNAGQVSGWYLDASGFMHSFLLSNGSFTTIDDTAFSNTHMNGINNAGEMVGSVNFGGGTSQQGVVLKGSSFTTLNVPNPFNGEATCCTDIVGINDAGQVVGGYLAQPLGCSSCSYSEHHGFVGGLGGPFTAIDVPGSTGTSAWGINNAGAIVGEYFDTIGFGYHGFLLSGGNYTTIEDLNLGYGTYATSINNLGQIVGPSFLYSGGTYTPIYVPNADVGILEGINDQGKLVGDYIATGVHHGFVATPPTPTPDPVVTTLSCSPDAALVAQPTTCTATVTDTTATPTTPTGVISLTTPGGGSFAAPSCTLIPLAANRAACTDVFTPTATGIVQLSASYPGDALHSSAAGVFNLQVVELAITASPDHVWANGHKSTTLTVHYLSSHAVTLAAAPSAGLTFTPSSLTQTTSLSGQAQWTVTSTKVNNVTVTASDQLQPAISSTATVHFERHKIVFQFLGINSSLNCSGTTCVAPVVVSGGFSFNTDVFPYIRSQLLSQEGFAAADMLWYSYAGGSVDTGTGEWHPASYPCDATAQRYQADIYVLSNRLQAYAQANPNTDLYLVGHSQGGLIAFQELGFLSQLPPTSKVAAIMTMDSPLGGSPSLNAWLASISPTVCWKGPAVRQLGAFYNLLPIHDLQGTDSDLLCIFLAVCPDISPLGFTNRAAVLTALTKGTRVYTYENSDDATYLPEKCNFSVPPVDSDYRTTEIVAGATVTVAPLGGNTPQPSIALTLGNGNIHSLKSFLRFLARLKQSLINQADICVTNSHHQVTVAEAAAIAAAIGQQDQ